MTATLNRTEILRDASRQMRERHHPIPTRATVRAMSDLLWSLAELAEDGRLPAIVLDGVAVAQAYLGGAK